LLQLIYGRKSTVLCDGTADKSIVDDGLPNKNIVNKKKSGIAGNV
jgi:hypothetical protein